MSWFDVRMVVGFGSWKVRFDVGVARSPDVDGGEEAEEEKGDDGDEDPT